MVPCCRQTYNSALQRLPARHSWRVSLSNTSKHSPSECTRILGSSRWKRSTRLGHVNRGGEPIAQGGPSYSLSLWIAAASKALMTPFGSCQVGQAHGFRAHVVQTRPKARSSISPPVPTTAYATRRARCASRPKYCTAVVVDTCCSGCLLRARVCRGWVNTRIGSGIERRPLGTQ